jgi:hypothetical protein
MDGHATELEIVRRELDALAVARGLSDWRPGDEARYQDLCQTERLLLTRS